MYPSYSRDRNTAPTTNPLGQASKVPASSIWVKLRIYFQGCLASCRRPTPNAHTVIPPHTPLPFRNTALGRDERMDFNSLKDQVSNLTLYDIKAGVRKVQNGKQGAIHPF